MMLSNDFSWRCIRLFDDFWIYAIFKGLCPDREDVPLYLVHQDFVPEEYVASMRVEEGWITWDDCNSNRIKTDFEIYDRSVSGSVPVWLVQKKWT